MRRMEQDSQDPEATVRDLIEKRYGQEPAWRVRQAIIKTLSTFRADEHVIAALIARLADPDEDVRATAAVALANMRAATALPALQRMAQTDIHGETTIRGLAVRNSWVASRAIEVIRTPEGPPVLDWPY